MHTTSCGILPKLLGFPQYNEEEEEEEQQQAQEEEEHEAHTQHVYPGQI